MLLLHWFFSDRVGTSILIRKSKTPPSRKNRGKGGATFTRHDPE